MFRNGAGRPKFGPQQMLSVLPVDEFLIGYSCARRAPRLVGCERRPQSVPVKGSLGAIPHLPARVIGFDMSHDHHAHPHSPGPARQRPPLRVRLPMAAYEPPPKYSDFLQRMLVRAKESLGEEFRGITADGIVRP